MSSSESHTVGLSRTPLGISSSYFLNCLSHCEWIGNIANKSRSCKKQRQKLFDKSHAITHFSVGPPIVFRRACTWQAARKSSFSAYFSWLRWTLAQFSPVLLQRVACLRREKLCSMWPKRHCGAPTSPC